MLGKLPSQLLPLNKLSNMADGDKQIEELATDNIFMKKYLAIRNKCEQLQQGNEKIVNRLQHVKKLVKRYKRERRFLQSRLDSYDDNYREAQVPVMWEEDQMYNMFRPPPPSPPSKEIDNPTRIPTQPAMTTPSQKSKSAKKIKTLLKSQDQQMAGSLQPYLRGLDQGTSNIDAMLFGTVVKQEYDAMNRTPIKMEPGEPKKSPVKRSAFLMFCDQYRHFVQNEFLREKNEIISQEELTRRLALKWNTLSPDDKRVYHDMFEIQNKQVTEEQEEEEDTVESLDSESTLAAIHLESDAAVSSLLSKQDL